ncbi:MAG: hypothetical protein EP330_11210 [Deltaproteobacteria bacterium]|nr:MAG: hypothetical protein EP330_11210 [Deltaproteobacteria bacterium]
MPARLSLVAALSMVAGCVSSNAPSSADPDPALEAPAASAEIRFSSALTSVDPSAIGPEVTIDVTWSQSIESGAWMRIDGEEVTPTGVGSRSQQLTLTLGAGNHVVTVGDGSGAYPISESFTITEPCAWAERRVQLQLASVSPGAPARASVGYPSQDFGVPFALETLVILEDDSAVATTSDTQAGYLAVTTQEVSRAGRRYEAEAVFACDGGSFVTTSSAQRIASNCGPTGESATLDLELVDGSAQIEAAWDLEKQAIYGEVTAASVVLYEQGPWCVDCASGEGTPVMTASSLDLTTGTLSASHAASPNHHYRAELHLECSADQARQSTSTMLYSGASGVLTEPSLLAGRVFASRGKTFQLTRPASPDAEELEEFLHMNWLPMLAIDAVDGDQVTSRMVWSRPAGDAPLQRPCSETVPLPTGTLTDGALHVGPADIGVKTGMGTLRVYDFELDGTVGADGASLKDITFEGLFDMRDLAAEVGYPNADALCEDASTYAMTCIACPDGVEACVDLAIGSVEGFDAPHVEPEELVCDGIEEEVVFFYGENRLVTTTYGSSTLRAVSFDGGIQWEVTTPNGCPIRDVSSSDGQGAVTSATLRGNDLAVVELCPGSTLPFVHLLRSETGERIGWFPPY